MPNVKAGDIARVIGPHQPAMALVAVEDRCPEDEAVVWHCNTLSSVFGYTEGWISVGTVVPPGEFMHIADKYLRPLHDGDGEDEVLRLTGKPKKTDADILKSANNTVQAANRLLAFITGKAN